MRLLSLYFSKHLFLLVVCANLLVGCQFTRSFMVPPNQPPMPLFKQPEVVLVLGGGGARSVAHAGVIEILEKHRIPIDLIIGSSAGSAVGVMYADNPDYRVLKERVFKVQKWDMLDPSVLYAMQGMFDNIGPISGQKMEEFFYQNLQTKQLELLKIPCIVVTTNMDNNTLYLIGAGPIAPAIHASAAIPPFFSPVNLYGHLLADGGIIAPVPVEVAKRFKPKLIIAVDISLRPGEHPTTNMVFFTYRAIEIMYYKLARMQAALADINIHPHLGEIGMFNDHSHEALYESGRRETLKHIERLKVLMLQRGIKFREEK